MVRIWANQNRLFLWTHGPENSDPIQRSFFLKPQESSLWCLLFNFIFTSIIVSQYCSLFSLCRQPQISDNNSHWCFGCGVEPPLIYTPDLSLSVLGVLYVGRLLLGFLTLSHFRPSATHRHLFIFIFQIWIIERNLCFLFSLLSDLFDSQQSAECDFFKQRHVKKKTICDCFSRAFH